MSKHKAPSPKDSFFGLRLGASIFAIVLMAAMLIYAWSVLGTARGIVDWMLIVPASGIGAVLLLWLAVADYKATKRLDKSSASHPPSDAQVAQPEPVPEAPVRHSDRQPVALLFLILAYALSLEFIGFDVATALFLSIALSIQGERRIWLIAANAVIGTWLLVWIFQDLLLVKLPTLFL